MGFTASFIEKHQLPNHFHSVAENHYLPLCNWVISTVENKKSRSVKPLVLGINGAQGTGKSTLADFIAEYLKQDSDWHIAVISIDDFYLTKADRMSLAKRVHPLLATRGVPGTHDLSLAFDVMEQLISGASQVALPRFDKSMDDRFEKSRWPKTSEPVDLIILEGWCVGSVHEPENALKEPINSLESIDDASSEWRTYVNSCLKVDYQKLFALLDHLILLKAPDVESVFRWRLEQEGKLADKADKKATGLMSADQLARFIQHYERLTRHNLQVLLEKADIVLALNQDHQVV